MMSKTSEEIAEVLTIDVLDQEVTIENSQIQPNGEQSIELTPTVECATLEESNRHEEKQAEETSRYIKEQCVSETAKLDDQIARLERRSDFAELERCRSLDACLSEQQTDFRKQLDERDNCFAQLKKEYDILQVRFDQLQQAHEDLKELHEKAITAKQLELTNSLRNFEQLQAQAASLENQLKAEHQANQNALLLRAEQQALEKQGQLDEANARVKVLEDELELLSPASSGNDHAAQIRGLQQEIYAKSEQLVEQGEKHLRMAELLNKAKLELVHVRKEVGHARGILLRGIGLDPTITTCGQDIGIDDKPYQHVKLEELIRLRLKAFELECQFAGGPSPSLSSSGAANDEDRFSTEPSSCHLSNVESFSALDALGLGSVGRLEREMRVLRSRNKRLVERTERLEGELDTAQAGLCDLQSMREKVVEMASRERVEKDLRVKSEQANKELDEKVAALSEHVEKLMIHLKHEAAAKTRAVDAHRRVEKELVKTKDKVAVATRKYAVQEAKAVEVEQGARILEDQLRLMDEKFIDVRNKLDWTRSAARKANKQLSAENRSLHMKWQLARDSRTLNETLDQVSDKPTSQKSNKLTLSASRSDSRLPTSKTSSNGLPPVVASMMQDALAIRNKAQGKIDIPRLLQPESDAGTPWSDAKLAVLQRQFQDKRRV